MVSFTNPLHPQCPSWLEESPSFPSPNFVIYSRIILFRQEVKKNNLVGRLVIFLETFGQFSTKLKTLRSIDPEAAVIEQCEEAAAPLPTTSLTCLFENTGRELKDRHKLPERGRQ
jgi:hypothetical protein